MATSSAQRGFMTRSPILLGVVVVLLFVCAVLLKISSERANEITELDSLLLDSRRTIDRTSRERDLAILGRKETATELDKIKNSKGTIQNEKNKLVNEVTQLKQELDNCKKELEAARAEKDELEQTLHVEKENADNKIDELTSENNRLATENQELKQAENQRFQQQQQQKKKKKSEHVATSNTDTPATNSTEKR